MPNPKLAGYSAEHLVDEVRAREEKTSKAVGKSPLFSAPPANPALAEVSIDEIIEEIRGKQKVIYGVDDRQDWYSIVDSKVQVNAEAVAALVKASDLADAGGGFSQLPSRTFKERYGLCDSERFGPQPCCAFCTGFVVGEDLMATAGHCVTDYLDSIQDLRFVFGFRMTGATTAATRIANTEIYAGKKIIDRRLTASGTDWALVQLDRKVVNRPILPMRRSGKVADGAPVYVIGHPCGIPLKYAPGAAVRDNTPLAFFAANLDTYGGNSGSPVFNAAHEVEGILVRGDTDFVSQGGCRVSLVQPSTGGRGEDVTRTSEFQHLVPKQP